MKAFIICHTGDFLNDPSRPFKKRVNIIEIIKYKKEQYFITIETQAPFYWVGKYNLTHLETGLRACNSNSKRGLIKELKERLIKYPNAIEKCKKKLIKEGIKLPVNKIKNHENN